MKNKGFTLIELIGTIVILALILLIVTPIITRSIKNGVSNSDEQVKANIVLAAKNWASDHKGQLPTKVYVSTLQNEGYLDVDVKLPSNENKDISSSCVIITNKTPANASKKVYNYEYSENNCS